MHDDEIRRYLRERNPWWRAAASGGDVTAWVRHDPTLNAAAVAGIEHHPDVLADVTAGGLWVVRGPRRVGKSVAAKRLVAGLCAGPEPRAARVVYAAADGFRVQDLRRLFTIGRELAGAGPLYWIIDEVSSVVGWPAAIKELRDNTPLAHDAVVLTGSSAGDLADARSALGPGRTGTAHPFRVLLPMTFREYLRASKAGVPLPDQVTPDALRSAAAASAIAELAPFVDDLDLAWQQFNDIGGFPRAVADHVAHGDVSDAFTFDLLSWLAGDVEHDRPVESVLELLVELHRRTGSPLNQAQTAEALHISRDRFRVRCHRMVSTFAAHWCPQGDEHGAAVPGSQSKLYLIDPLLARLPTLRDPALPAPDATRLTESSLARELAQATDRVHPDRFVEGRAIRYSRAGAGGEVDFAPVPIAVAGVRSRTVAVESKWVSRQWRGEALAVRRRFGGGVLATKDLVDIDDPEVWAVPAPMVALLLN
ncbi:MAG: ATP-binding protein [Pseudonocardia sp.]